jgi:hypothetical protein
MIRKCDCLSYMGSDQAAKYQDKKYGKGKRVKNKCYNSSKGIWVCTVCGKCER